MSSDQIHSDRTSGSRTSRGWWRRNRWGLVALLPALALAVALPVHDGYAQYWDTAPRTPIGDGSTATFAGATIHLDTLAPATGLAGYGGTPITIPARVRVWHAKLDFRSTDPAALAACDLRMEGTDGSTYDAGPSELLDLGADVEFPSCDPQGTGPPPPAWSTDVYFVAPAGTRPAAVRVILATRLPRYARLTPP